MIVEYLKMVLVVFVIQYCICFFLSGFSFTKFGNSQDSRYREGKSLYSSLKCPRETGFLISKSKILVMKNFPPGRNEIIFTSNQKLIF